MLYIMHWNLSHLSIRWFLVGNKKILKFIWCAFIVMHDTWWLVSDSERIGLRTLCFEPRLIGHVRTSDNLCGIRIKIARAAATIVATKPEQVVIQALNTCSHGERTKIFLFVIAILLLQFCLLWLLFKFRKMRISLALMKYVWAQCRHNGIQ